MAIPKPHDIIAPLTDASAPLIDENFTLLFDSFEEAGD